MAASTFSALPKRHWEPFSRSLDSIESIYDSPTPVERICMPQRPSPTDPTPTQTWSTCHSACHPQPSSTTKSLGTASSEIVRK